MMALAREEDVPEHVRQKAIDVADSLEAHHRKSTPMEKRIQEMERA